MSEQLVWTEEEAAEMKERFQRRFGEPLPRTESLFAVAAVGYRKGLNTRPSPTEIEALRAEVERLRTDGASAVQWAPGSAYWSEVLVELFGPDARKGIDVLERRWQAALERADTAEALLRQALEALLGQRGEPDWHTGKQRENAIAALRERLGKGGPQ